MMVSSAKARKMFLKMLGSITKETDYIMKKFLKIIETITIETEHTIKKTQNDGHCNKMDG